MTSKGQYFYNARWYDPNLGRFTTEDPIRSGLNWFIYANNNPLRFVDPTGLKINNPNVDDVRMTKADDDVVLPSKLENKEKINQVGCSAISWARGAFSAAGRTFSQSEFEAVAQNEAYFNDEGIIDRNAMWKGITGNEGAYGYENESSEIPGLLKQLAESDNTYTITGRARIKTESGKKEFHEVLITGITLNDNGDIESVEYAPSSGHDETGNAGEKRVYTAEGEGDLFDFSAIRYQKHEE